jgi:hypothetical protein
MAKAEKKKFEVLKVFRDKITGKRHIAGSVYESENPERIDELQQSGHIGDEVKAVEADSNAEALVKD